MSDVFISYTRPELALVEPLRNKLVGLRLHCFFDTENLDSGDLWARKIDKEVKASRCVLGCWSKAALESEWVNNECREGWRADNRRLVAAVIAPFTKDDVPVEFNAVQYDDFIGYNGDDADPRFAHLLVPIGRYVGRPGLARFQSAIAARDAAAMADWIKAFPTDPLVPEAMMRIASVISSEVSPQAAAPSETSATATATATAPATQATREPVKTPKSGFQRPALEFDD